MNRLPRQPIRQNMTRGQGATARHPQKDAHLQTRRGEREQGKHGLLEAIVNLPDLNITEGIEYHIASRVRDEALMGLPACV